MAPKYSDGVRSLLRRVRDNDPTLTEVDLSHAELGDNGARELASALRYNTEVISLELWDNGIGNEGVVALTQMLQENTTIVHLWLAYNSIGNQGAKALAQMLRHNSAIKIVSLAGNSITEEGAEALAKALVSNQTIEDLHLEHNSISDGGVNALACALQLNGSVARFELCDYVYGKRGKRALTTAMRNLGGEGVCRGELEVFAKGLFDDKASFQLGLGDLGAVQQRLAAGDIGAGELELCADPLGVGATSKVNRAGQPRLLGIVYETGMKKIIEESISMETEATTASILERVAATVGVAGIFGAMREHPKLCMPPQQIRKGETVMATKGTRLYSEME